MINQEIAYHRKREQGCREAARKAASPAFAALHHALGDQHAAERARISKLAKLRLMLE